MKSNRSITSHERWQSKHRSEYLQFCLPAAVRCQFHTAVNSIEFVAYAMPDFAKTEFERAYGAIDQLQLIARLLRESRRVVFSKDRPNDERWFHKTRQDLFDCLGPSTRKLLLQQGLQL